MPPFPTPFTISPLSNHTHTLILLHTRSSDGQSFGLDFLSATTSSGSILQTLFPGTKFIFPTATAQCVTSHNGIRTNQWFDLLSTKNPAEREALQVKGLREGSLFIHSLIDMEVDAGVDQEKVFLGGFGMGAAMALYALLTHRGRGQGRLGGFVGLSGWLPLRGSMETWYEGYEDHERDDHVDELNNLLRGEIGMPQIDEYILQFKETPVFLSHGRMDDEISIELARDAAHTLCNLGLDVTLKECSGLGHGWRTGDEMDDITSFLSTQGMG